MHGVLGFVAVALLGIASPPPASGAEISPLRIVFVDVEGGAATLLVTPAGESILIDCGSRCPDSRDARRIVRAARRLGLARIDHVAITHYHSDHIGGVGQLAERIPLDAFHDRGPCEILPEDPNFPSYWADYMRACGGKHRMLSPGDRLPLARRSDPPVEILCVAARRSCMDGARSCRIHERAPLDPSDNARSLAFLISCGGFRFFLGGDITANVEHDLVCPENRVGTVDLFQVDHHGLPVSNSPLFVRAIDPTVAIIANGPRKGAHPRVHEALREAPGLKAVWQLHRNLARPTRGNPPPAFIANAREPCEGVPIVVEVQPASGRFTVRCGFDGAPRAYRIGGHAGGRASGKGG